jgi:hypothetical protein
MITGSVIKRAKGKDGNPIGRRHTNPILDTREYEVQFQNQLTTEYSPNMIAENICSQCDSDGREFQLFIKISDHKKDASAVSKDDGFTISQNGNKIPMKATRGWKVNIKWKDGTSSWVPLKEIKSSNGIAEEPEMAWWVKDL